MQFAAIHIIIADNRLDCDHICNLYETGMSLNREYLKYSHKKAYVIRSSNSVKRSPDFRNINRVTLMLVVFASGCNGWPLFVVKVERIKFRVVKSNSHSVVETISGCLSQDSLVTCRDEVAGSILPTLPSGRRSL